VVGHGVVGDRVVRRLPTAVVGVEVVGLDRHQQVTSGRALPQVDLAVLTHPQPHHDAALELLERGVHVISVSDDLDDVRELVELDDLARSNGVSLVVGGGASPGLTELLCRYLAMQLVSVDELHVAVHGTAGPACARQHHRMLSGRAVGWHDGEWIWRPAGSGRELCWFPEPVGAYDCYRAEMASPLLLQRSFPGVARISARVSANRRDRLTAWLPMLTPPHSEGGVGALRVEARGCDDSGGRATLVVGIAELVGTTSAAVTCALAAAVVAGTIPEGVVITSDDRLDTLGLLRSIDRLGVRLQTFTGVPNPMISEAA
jgi:hypothetical protein